MALVPVTVAGRFTEGNRPAVGVIDFLLAWRLIDTEENLILEPVSQDVALDIDGHFEFVLHTVTGMEAGYWVTERIVGRVPRPAYLVGIYPTDEILLLSELTPPGQPIDLPPAPVVDDVDGGAVDDGDWDGGSPYSTYDVDETIDGGTP